MGWGWRSIAGGSGRRGGQDLGEVVADGLPQLVVGGGGGVAVGAPADELGGVAEPAALQVVIADLDHPLGSQRGERQLLARVPAAAVGPPPGAAGGLGLPPPGAPVPGVALEAGAKRLGVGGTPPAAPRPDGART